MSSFDPTSLIQTRRKINGVSAILLPFTSSGEVDWSAFVSQLGRTVDAGLTPAVNMDTGYVNLLDHALQNEVLRQCQAVMGNRPFVAGAFVADREGDAFQPDRYLERMDCIQSFGGTPILFQSYGLTRQSGLDIVSSYEKLAAKCDRFLGFELTTELAPFGAVYDLETFTGLMSIPQCKGLKHSSFHRQPEWERLRLRNARRPDFMVYTGNDRAIDMVIYGSDYLLGLSTFAPDLFALRDQYWLSGDDRFYELNDQLQYLGCFTFRSPSSAYKHSAAQFLQLRGWFNSDRTHPRSATRPDSDVEVLREIATRLNIIVRT